jgi:hypothetical protein
MTHMGCLTEFRDAPPHGGGKVTTRSESGGREREGNDKGRLSAAFTNVEPSVGIEPTTFSLPWKCSTD